ncbi:MAG: HYExAFE family protein [Phycisphaerae bacterium]|nr:HYExAFE family protein [Phycisphaerae bacterium]
MAKRGEHYEQSFEAYLNHCQLPYVPVSQQHKALFAGNSLKSFDFIVYPKKHFKNRVPIILVDVKGRKLPFKDFNNNKHGENWVTNDDIESMQQWQEIFRADKTDDYLAIFVFAYWIFDIPEDFIPQTACDLFINENKYYYFTTLDLAAYCRHMTDRSEKWQTVNMPRKIFRQLTCKFKDFINARNT